MSIFGEHGITANTPKDILLGAGTYHKNLAFADGNWTGEILGATSGGGKVSIVGELQDLEIDGALVKVKGLTVKQGGTASMDVNFAEVNSNNLKYVTLFEEAEESDVAGYTQLQDKATISEGDYIENLAFVGKTLGGKTIVVIFDYALCTSGAEFEPKNKEQTIFKGTFEAAAELEGSLNKLPVRIYYPAATASENA